MRVYLGQCNPKGDFFSKEIRHCQLDGGLYGKVYFVTKSTIRLKDGHLLLMGVLEDTSNCIASYSSHPISPFFYGDEVEFEYDPNTHDIWAEKKNHSYGKEPDNLADDDDDGTWCLSPILRRTRSGL